MKGSSIHEARQGKRSSPRSFRRSWKPSELVFERKVGENDHLFGSVTSGDIAHQLEEKGFTIDRRKISAHWKSTS